MGDVSYTRPSASAYGNDAPEISSSHEDVIGDGDDAHGDASECESDRDGGDETRGSGDEDGGDAAAVVAMTAAAGVRNSDDGDGDDEAMGVSGGVDKRRTSSDIYDQ